MKGGPDIRGNPELTARAALLAAVGFSWSWIARNLIGTNNGELMRAETKAAEGHEMVPWAKLPRALKAYKLRRYGLAWFVVADKCGFIDQEQAQRAAQRAAERHRLQWPIVIYTDSAAEDYQ